jgi:hypothetical protein
VRFRCVSLQYVLHPPTLFFLSNFKKARYAVEAWQTGIHKKPSFINDEVCIAYTEKYRNGTVEKTCVEQNLYDDIKALALATRPFANATSTSASTSVNGTQVIIDDTFDAYDLI